MSKKRKWGIPAEEKKKFIAELTKGLPALRARAGVSQDDLSKLIGISRQTLGAIERGEKAMSWNIYLCLIMFFDCNNETHQMLREINNFHDSLILRFNDNNTESINDVELSSLFEKSAKEMFTELDEQALSTLKTTFLVEYVRCSKLPVESIVKAFKKVNLVK